jgi:hypothetical protein
VNDTHPRPGTSLHLSTDFPEAGPSHLANHESVHPPLLGALEVPSCEMSNGKELDRRDGFMAEPPLSTTDLDGHPQDHSSRIQPSAEHMRKSPENSMPRVDTRYPPSGSINPRSSESFDTNSILPPDNSTSTLNPPNGGESLHELPFPRPPPEVAALLTAQSVGKVVSPVFARNSPLVPWKLPSEIRHFWLGLFKISEVKVTHACHRQATDLTSLWVCLFARWKRVRGETPQTLSQRSIPGAFLWNGCLVARIYFSTMSSKIIMSGPLALCGHGGSKSTSRWSKVLLSNALASCFLFLFLPPFLGTLLRVVISQLAISVQRVAVSMCNAFFGIESVKALLVAPMWTQKKK